MECRNSIYECIAYFSKFSRACTSSCSCAPRYIYNIRREKSCHVDPITDITHMGLIQSWIRSRGDIHLHFFQLPVNCQCLYNSLQLKRIQFHNQFLNHCFWNFRNYCRSRSRLKISSRKNMLLLYFSFLANTCGKKTCFSNTRSAWKKRRRIEAEPMPLFEGWKRIRDFARRRKWQLIELDGQFALVVASRVAHANMYTRTACVYIIYLYIHLCVAVDITMRTMRKRVERFAKWQNVSHDRERLWCTCRYRGATQRNRGTSFSTIVLRFRFVENLTKSAGKNRRRERERDT